MTITNDPVAVRYFDYRPRYRELRTEIDEAIRNVLDSGTLILGPEVDSFEAEFASYTGARHAVAVASGTDAITLALRALDIGPGDEVVTVSHTAVASIAGIRATGAMPRFVDVQPDTLLIDPAAIEAACGEKTRAIMPVHLYGNPVCMEPIREIADRKGLFIVEDCAQAFGTLYSEAHVGTLGDVGCFSFYPTKNLGAFGDGGACVSNDEETAERIRKLRMYGFQERDGNAHLEGLNSRLDELQASVLRVKLRHIDVDLAERRRLANLYDRELRGEALVLPTTTPEGRHSYHLFVIRTSDRDSTIRNLDRAHIGFGIHYPIPVHLMDAYQRLLRQPITLPQTETACREILSLPLYPGLRDDEVGRVCEALKGS